MTARILVVDDEPDLESLLVQKFRREIREGAIHFLFARDGVEALAVLEENGDVDMVVTDINMPRMDGLTLLERLQGDEKRLSTIIVSAYGDMANIRTAMNRGAFDFVTKPVDPNDLELTIDKTLETIAYVRELDQQRADAERARANLARYFSPNLVDLLAESDEPLGEVTFSAGLTKVSGEDNYQSAFQRADQLLYSAKEAGRNCVHLG